MSTQEDIRRRSLELSSPGTLTRRARLIGRHQERLREQIAALALERAEIVRSMHDDHGMKLKEISAGLGLSIPRCSEIMHLGDEARPWQG